MKKDEIVELLEMKSADDAVLDKIVRYADLLVEWNKKINLTAIRDERSIYLKHFKDSLQVVSFLDQVKIESLVDVGSGAGFPGIPIGILYGDIRVYLVESVGKKVKFLENVIGVLGLKQVKAVNARIEDLSGKHSPLGKVDAVVGRAIFYLPIMLELCSGLVRENGYIIAYKSCKGLAEELSDAKDIVQMYNLVVEREIRYSIEDDDRVLIIYKKTKEVNDFKPRPLIRLKKMYKRG
ncbi:MAG: 16S rRNA (guanine(527)-N(7))-methyltransferase RsmG [Candidatus Margulisiibacteriota bacterium]|nr:MAG: 16S rRNA (guanine(527)-N(7))-methyltransferase RsmG [Candidatus Margulisbacteria bacterium GWD2_39_127]OGI02391.1 MAG: 16S rRNA (guanine(527)-N(7))-methyltransferase RsmG [Candidatus Margulisbacteria bacterium GWF2_38_17]OGI08523.1 MAG: 16S rRNA (guanine(527)-N(7))-methyltransferase RsmG [Candidatus Margulisbacteria bacterium GWE2_39_32]PZM78173.1 MAG: 16S rRNA (guanine(527)-N(7))-methyltransferase RsmG [Candidatus Margulisiibacteriota bacterium]HAR63434.1 16S rRNA (guanine(527)-N(7))-m